MLSNLFYILNTVREEILEAFILPELGISYWDYLCLLAIVGIVITVLINSVQVSAGRSARLKNVAERESARISARDKHNSSHGSSDLDVYESYMANK